MAKHTILLIDYEPRSIERFRDPLTAAGYSVEIATDGVSGIEAFHRLSPDMVLVEAMIPKKHGFEVCQELKRTAHGRQTPVIITTGVYKGRKYRTQAQHIYGCDEYIEKPIAPEQLLEIVGKFLGSENSGRSGRATESARVPSEVSGRPSANDRVDAIGKPAPAIVRDDTEGEIMARLDAILPGSGDPTSPYLAPERMPAVAAVDEDFFAQMRAELDAELGANLEPFAFESAPKLEPIPESIPSDQVMSPSVLEALPNPEAELQVIGKTDPSGPSVGSGNKRNHKSKKSDRQSKGRTPQVTRSASAPEAVVPAPVALPVVPASVPVSPAPKAVVPEPEAVAPVVVAPPVFVSEVTLPRGTIVESELELASGQRGRAVWIWLAVGVVAIVALVFMFVRGGSNGSTVATKPAATPKVLASTPPAVSAPPVPSQPPVASAPAETLATVPETAPVTNVVEPPASKISPEPVKFAAPKVPPRTAPAPAPASTAAVQTIVPGALIPIDVADAMPVARSHRGPVFSTETKQLQLSGMVTINVLVNDRGTVDQVVLVTGVPGGDVNDAVLRAAKSWTYRPATKNGVPVKVWKSEQIVVKP